MLFRLLESNMFFHRNQGLNQDIKCQHKIWLVVRQILNLLQMKKYLPSVIHHLKLKKFRRLNSIVSFDTIDVYIHTMVLSIIIL
jgi:hypothetical protein